MSDDTQAQYVVADPADGFLRVQLRHDTICLGQSGRHALAAVLLDGQPFGFTHDDVALLWGIAHHFQASTGDRAYSDKIASLAARIATLLPPEETMRH